MTLLRQYALWNCSWIELVRQVQLGRIQNPHISGSTTLESFLRQVKNQEYSRLLAAGLWENPQWFSLPIEQILPWNARSASAPRAS